MSLSNIGKTSQLFAAATVISAVGFLTVPAPAQADRMLPLAPACASFEFTNARIDMWQDNGVLATVQGYGTQVGNTGQYNIPGQTEATYGNPTGGIMGRAVNMIVSWTKGPGAGGSTQYRGQIDDNGYVSGTSDNLKGDISNWKTHEALKCVPPAAPAPPPPPPPPPPATALVTSDVDVYDAPGGNGNVIGILRVRSQVHLVGSCKPEDWCHVSGPAVPPNGDGWVWGSLSFA
jgi:hypothetical protein